MQPPEQPPLKVFDPRDYGARFDRVHDDTAAIQAAINAATAPEQGAEEKRS